MLWTSKNPLWNDEENCYRFVIDELGKIYPSEILCNRKFTQNKKNMKIIKNKINPYINAYDDINEVDDSFKENITGLLKIKSLDEVDISG